MARIARIVVPGIPHHIVQRGNRRQETFFGPADYQQYLSLMSEWCNECKVQVVTYCLMPNHVHLIAVPETEDGLRRAIGEAHRRYTRFINFREGWRGHLWQGRFASFPMDENYLLATVRYILLNPVRAGLAGTAGEYPWSSASAHLTEKNDTLVSVEFLEGIIDNWQEFLSGGSSDSELETLRQHERTGRPLGGEPFLRKLESKVKRVLQKHRPGPKKKS